MNSITSSKYADILERIAAGLEAARTVFARFTPGAIETEYKIGHDPVTEADRSIDTVLRQNLLREGEGWLSEETTDDVSRLSKSRVWVVDPLDGTREFVQGIPEFCASIGFVEDGRPVAGGICNPAWPVMRRSAYWQRRSVRRLSTLIAGLWPKRCGMASPVSPSPLMTLTLWSRQYLAPAFSILTSARSLRLLASTTVER